MNETMPDKHAATRDCESPNDIVHENLLVVATVGLFVLPGSFALVIALAR